MPAISLLRQYRPFAALVVVLAAFALSDCGDDDPTSPGGGTAPDSFDQATATSQARASAVGWEIMSPGITISGQGGCPTGAIRYDFAPFYSLVQFNGGTVATSTLHTANGSVVSDGGSSHPLSCSTQ